ncbi:MAG: pseudaminic acid cytidylyltransferase, partial [Verrucomicrobiota bacterium]
IELGCCVYATSVFVTPELFQKGLNLLDQRRDAPSVVSVTRFSFPVLRGLQMNEQSEVDFVWPEHKNTRSQDLAPCFHDAAQFYWFRSEDFLAQKNLFMPGSLGLEIPESEIQDIDNEVDWKLAELKFKLKYGEKTDE